MPLTCHNRVPWPHSKTAPPAAKLTSVSFHQS